MKEVGTDWKLGYGHGLACDNRKAEDVDENSDDDLVYSFFSAEYGEENDDEYPVSCVPFTMLDCRLSPPFLCTGGLIGFLDLQSLHCAQ